MMNPNKCVFCEIIIGNIKARKIHETEHSIAILDAFPLKKGHSLLISKTHRPKIQDLSIEENSDIFSTLHFLTEKIEKAMDSNSSLISINNCIMVGDRLDIDIMPANELGMKTIRTLNSLYKIQRAKNEKEAPLVTINSLTELPEILLCIG